LPAHHLSQGNEDPNQQKKQDCRQPGDGEKVEPVPHLAGRPKFQIGGRTQALRKAFESLPAAPGQADDQQQSHESFQAQWPAHRLPRQAAAQTKPYEAQQQREILEIGEDADFDGDPSNERQLGKQRQKAGDEELVRTPDRESV